MARSTIFDHVKDLHPKIGAGAPTILMPQEERETVVILQVLQEIGFGLTKDLVLIVICDYLNDQPLRPNPFCDGIPGKDWWSLFLKHLTSQLGLRKPQHLPTRRASAALPEVMAEWFKRFESLFSETDLSSEELKCHFWNCVETGSCEVTEMFIKQLEAVVESISLF